MMKTLLLILKVAFLAVAYYLYQFQDVGIPALGVAFFAGVIELAQHFLGDKTTDSTDGTRQVVCLRALRQLETDIKNFEYIAQNRFGKYSSPQHRTAVEVGSFACVKREITPLKKFPRYWWLVRNSIQEIDANAGKLCQEMDVSRLITVLRKLENKLRIELGE